MARCIVVIVCSLFLSCGFADVAKYNRTIDYIEKMGKDIYCYWDIKKEQFGVDWQQVIATARNKINENTTDGQFEAILTQIASSLHDGHVNYIYSKNQVYYVPIDVKPLGSDYYISAVDSEDFFPTTPDLNPGDKLISINGIAIDEYIKDRSHYVSGSTANSIASYAASSINSLPKFKKAPQTTMVITVEDYLTKQVKKIELPWLIYNRNFKAQSSSSADVVQAKILPGNIGVLTLTKMHHDDGMAAHIAAIKQAMVSLKNTDALIVDVRNNGGGWGEIGDTVVGHLIKKPVRRYQIQLKNSMQVIFSRPELVDIFTNIDPNNDTYSEWQDVMIAPIGNQNGQPFYSKPAYVLTNERCFSACDTFVDSFSSNKIGLVLGTQSGGGTGYPLWIDLPYNFGNFRFSVLRGYSNHDHFLEGTGTIPDVYIQNTPHDLYNKVDGELLRAYQYVTQKLGIKQNQAVLAGQAFKPQSTKIIPYVIAQEQRQQLQRFH